MIKSNPEQCKDCVKRDVCSHIMDVYYFEGQINKAVNEDIIDEKLVKSPFMTVTIECDSYFKEKLEEN